MATNQNSSEVIVIEDSEDEQMEDRSAMRSNLEAVNLNEASNSVICRSATTSVVSTNSTIISGLTTTHPNQNQTERSTNTSNDSRNNRYVRTTFQNPGPSRQRNNRQKSHPYIRPPQVPSPDNENKEPAEAKAITIICPICLECILSRKPVSTNCGHFFCHKCLVTALRSNKKCPMCQKKLNGKGFIEVFF